VNTFIRLVVLIPATLFAILMAWIGIGFGGLSFWSIALNLTLVAIPASLVVWAIWDDFMRNQKQSWAEFNHD